MGKAKPKFNKVKTRAGLDAIAMISDKGVKRDVLQGDADVLLTKGWKYAPVVAKPVEEVEEPPVEEVVEENETPTEEPS